MTILEYAAFAALAVGFGLMLSEAARHPSPRLRAGMILVAVGLLLSVIYAATV